LFYRRHRQVHQQQHRIELRILMKVNEKFHRKKKQFFILASSPKNLLPLRLDERKDCEFALPFHYEGDSSTHPGTSLINI
jgi:hypothetical protein